MVLYYRAGESGLGMDDDALKIWIAVTEDRILLESLIVLGEDGNGLEAHVDSVVRRRGEGGRRRDVVVRLLPNSIAAHTIAAATIAIDAP